MKKLVRMKNLIFICALIAMILSSISYSLAYYSNRASQVENTIKKAYSDILISEDFDGTTKSSIRIQNTGTTPEYIRVKLITNWQSNDKIIAKSSPNLEISIANNWILIDGFYYYQDIVDVGEEVELLKEPIILDTDSSGNRMCVDVLASAVQSYPSDAARECFKVNLENNRIVK